MAKRISSLESYLLADPFLYDMKRDLKCYGTEGIELFYDLYCLEKIRCGLYHISQSQISDNIESYKDCFFEAFNSAYERLLQMYSVTRNQDKTRDYVIEKDEIRK